MAAVPDLNLFPQIRQTEREHFHQESSFGDSPGFSAANGDGDLSVIGMYGSWAAGLMEGKLPSLSFRRPEFTNLDSWRAEGRKRLEQRMSIPDIGGLPVVKVKQQLDYDGLHIEELSWALPYGRPTEAILLKPKGVSRRLPAILAFHDHAGNKYFGARKITRTSANQHPMMDDHQKEYYESLAWANEVAKRGYVVLVPDAFPFASRRVMMRDVPAAMRRGLTDEDPENPVKIAAYNTWAADHEPVMAKSLFCAGTTWPGVFFAEDRKALDILCSRPDVDPARVGCGGLSGGGMRTVFMAGLDDRIRCAVTVGFMTTWKDFLLNKSSHHTWMIYVPLLPNELDFPEILGLHAPAATLVLNDMADDLYTMPEMQTADKLLREIYRKANNPQSYQCSFYPGPHKFDRAMQKEAFDWFDKWLKS
jgi:dienelactone hydrolase